jgi:hypothetical protein
MLRLLLVSLLALAGPSVARATDFDLGLAYGQSRDFWRLVGDIQDRTGNAAEIDALARNRYGKPDVIYSYLDASYSYPHDHFDWEPFGALVIGTRAEALAGGEISNPISPEIQAYANATGIASIGYRSLNAPGRRTIWEARLLGGVGPEKRLYAQGAEFLDTIPVRNGALFLGGAFLQVMNRAEPGEDFFVTTDFYVRGVYFHSTADAPRSRPDEDLSFFSLRWKLQNEWLKEIDTFLSSRTRLGIISVLGQNPTPFLNLPVTWDYQQRLRTYPGFRSTAGIGGMARFLSESALPNVALYGGFFGGAFGGGADLQLGPVVLNASTYGLENFLSPSREKTRIWNATLGVAL